MADDIDDPIAPERRREMVKHAFETLVERAQYRVDDVRFIMQFLNKDVTGRWAGAIDAATITSQTANDAVYHAIDLALSQALKDHPLLEVVAELYNDLPRDTVALQLTATEVMRQTVSAGEERGRAEAHPDGYLDLLNNYTARLLQQREFGLAEETARKALAFAQRHQVTAPDTVAPGMAEAFGKLGTTFSLSGRDAEAEEPSRRAVDQYRALHSQFPGRYARDLAINLNNRVGLLDRLGDVAGAERASEEAVSLFRLLRDAAAEVEGARNLESWVRDVRPDLATALIARATILGKLERLEDELATAQEAVSILRPLVDDAPDQFLYLLGQALNNFAAALERQTRQEEAVAAMSEAVGIFERLTQLQPVFRQLLAHVLGSYLIALARADRLEEAAETGRRAVVEYETLVDAHPELYRSGLERTQANLAVVLGELRSQAGGPADD